MNLRGRRRCRFAPGAATPGARWSSRSSRTDHGRPRRDPRSATPPRCGGIVSHRVRKGEGINSRTSAPGTTVRRSGVTLALLLALGLFLTASAEALVYWANGGKNTIGRATLSGAGAHPFIFGADNPCGVAVNGSHVFWVNRGDPSAVTTSHIGRANLNGTGVNQKFIPNIGMEACGVDVNGTHIFWGNAFVQGVAGGGTIGRANLNGSGADPDFIDNQGGAVCGVDATNSFLYWANQGDFRISRGALDGSFDQPNYVAGVGIVCGVAVNSTHMHWASEGFAAIGRAPIPPFSQENMFIDTQFGSPCGVALNGTHLFWADGADIGRANINGSGVDLSFIRDPAPSDPSSSCGVAVDGLPAPAGTFKLGKLKLNKKAGTATLIVTTSWPGSVTASGKGVKKAKRGAKGVGKVKLPIKAKGKAKRKLNRTGRARVRVRVRHAASGGKTRTKTRRVRLIKRG